MKKIVIVLLSASFILWACNNETKDSVEKADSANQTKMDTPSVKQPIMADQETSSFLVKAANVGMTEVQVSDMAQQKAANQHVKDLAAMLVSDHTSANNQVTALAAQRNITLPAAVSDDSKKEMDGLAAKKVKDFDKAYVNAMIKGHNDAIDLFEKSDDKVNDTEVKTFITNTLPKLHMHLDSAKAVLKLLK